MHIKIPRNTLVILVGPAGCGKSTFAAKNFLPSQIVSSDECREMISDDATNQTVSRQAFELMHLIIDRRLLLGRLTVADATSLTKPSRRALQRLAERHRFNIAAIAFDVSLETCIERNKSRRRCVPDRAIAAQHELFSVALRDIAREGFDYLVVVKESEEDSLKVEIVRKRVRRWETK